VSHALILVPNHPAFYPHAERHASALRKCYDRVTVYSVFAKTDVLPILDGVDYVSGASEFPQGSAGFLRWMISAWKFIRKHRFDAVEAIDPPNLVPAAIALLFRKTKLVYFSMEIFPETPALAHRPLKRMVWTWLERVAVKRANQTLTVNRSVADYLQKSLSLAHIGVVRSMPPQQMVERDGSLRKMCGLGEQDFLLVYQGYLEPGRGIEMLANALQERANMHFAIMGLGPLQATIEARANTQANIHFCGKHPFERLMLLAAGADAGVVWIEPLSTSYRLSLPGKLFEYVQNGLPMLGSPLPEIKSHIQKYEIGEVAEDLSQRAMLIALDCLYEKIRNQAYPVALAKAKEQLCWEREQESLLHAFGEQS